MRLLHLLLFWLVWSPVSVALGQLSHLEQHHLHAGVCAHHESSAPDDEPCETCRAFEAMAMAHLADLPSLDTVVATATRPPGETAHCSVLPARRLGTPQARAPPTLS